MNAKQRVAAQAAEWVQPQMVVGLGTGSTANAFIDALAERVQSGLVCTAVASSTISANRARERGVQLQAIEHIPHLDLYVDGADEFTAQGYCLKGRGQDLVREKILARFASQWIVLVDESKRVDHIGARNPIPIEVLPCAWQLVHAHLQDLAVQIQLRTVPGGDNVFITAAGNLVIDAQFPSNYPVEHLNDTLSRCPGVIEHGLFLNLASVILVGRDDGIEHIPCQR